MYLSEVLLQAAIVIYCQILIAHSSGVLTVRLAEFKNPSGRTYDGTCCDPVGEHDDQACSDQCDYVMRLIVTGLGRANDHVFLFHRPMKYDSNNIEFDHSDSSLLLTVLFDQWPEDGLVKMNAFFYDYDDFDHTTTLVDWFETDLKHNSTATPNVAVWGRFQEQTVVGNRQLDKTILTFDWSIMHPDNEVSESGEKKQKEKEENDYFTTREDNLKRSIVIKQSLAEVTSNPFKKNEELPYFNGMRTNEPVSSQMSPDDHYNDVQLNRQVYYSKFEQNEDEIHEEIPDDNSITEYNENTHDLYLPNKDISMEHGLSGNENIVNHIKSDVSIKALENNASVNDFGARERIRILNKEGFSVSSTTHKPSHDILTTRHYHQSKNGLNTKKPNTSEVPKFSSSNSFHNQTAEITSSTASFMIQHNENIFPAKTETVVMKADYKTSANGHASKTLDNNKDKYKAFSVKLLNDNKNISLHTPTITSINSTSPSSVEIKSSQIFFHPRVPEIHSSYFKHDIGGPDIYENSIAMERNGSRRIQSSTEVSMVTIPVNVAYLTNERNVQHRNFSSKYLDVRNTEKMFTKQSTLPYDIVTVLQEHNSKPYALANISQFQDHSIAIKAYMADVTSLTKENQQEAGNDVIDDTNPNVDLNYENTSPKTWFNAKKFQKSNNELLHNNIQLLKSVKFQTAAPVMWFVTAQRTFTPLEDPHIEVVYEKPEDLSMSLTRANDSIKTLVMTSAGVKATESSSRTTSNEQPNIKRNMTTTSQSLQQNTKNVISEKTTNSMPLNSYTQAFLNSLNKMSSSSNQTLISIGQSPGYMLSIGIGRNVSSVASPISVHVETPEITTQKMHFFNMLGNMGNGHVLIQSLLDDTIVTKSSSYKTERTAQDDVSSLIKSVSHEIKNNSLTHAVSEANNFTPQNVYTDMNYKIEVLPTVDVKFHNDIDNSTKFHRMSLNSDTTSGVSDKKQSAAYYKVSQAKPDPTNAPITTAKTSTHKLNDMITASTIAIKEIVHDHINDQRKQNNYNVDISPTASRSHGHASVTASLNSMTEIIYNNIQKGNNEGKADKSHTKGTKHFRGAVDDSDSNFKNFPNTDSISYNVNSLTEINKSNDKKIEKTSKTSISNSENLDTSINNSKNLDTIINNRKNLDNSINNSKNLEQAGKVEKQKKTITGNGQESDYKMDEPTKNSIISEFFDDNNSDLINEIQSDVISTPTLEKMSAYNSLPNNFKKQQTLVQVEDSAAITAVMLDSSEKNNDEKVQLERNWEKFNPLSGKLVAANFMTETKTSTDNFIGNEKFRKEIPQNTPSNTIKLKRPNMTDAITKDTTKSFYLLGGKSDKSKLIVIDNLSTIAHKTLGVKKDTVDFQHKADSRDSNIYEVTGKTLVTKNNVDTPHQTVRLNKDIGFTKLSSELNSGAHNSYLKNETVLNKNHQTTMSFKNNPAGTENRSKRLETSTPSYKFKFSSKAISNFTTVNPVTQTLTTQNITDPFHLMSLFRANVQLLEENLNVDKASNLKASSDNKKYDVVTKVTEIQGNLLLPLAFDTKTNGAESEKREGLQLNIMNQAEDKELLQELPSISDIQKTSRKDTPNESQKPTPAITTRTNSILGYQSTDTKQLNTITTPRPKESQDVHQIAQKIRFELRNSTTEKEVDHNLHEIHKPLDNDDLRLQTPPEMMDKLQTEPIQNNKNVDQKYIEKDTLLYQSDLDKQKVDNMELPKTKNEQIEKQVNDTLLKSTGSMDSKKESQTQSLESETHVSQEPIYQAEFTYQTIKKPSETSEAPIVTRSGNHVSHSKSTVADNSLSTVLMSESRENSVADGHVTSTDGTNDQVSTRPTTSKNEPMKSIHIKSEPLPSISKPVLYIPPEMKVVPDMPAQRQILNTVMNTLPEKGFKLHAVAQNAQNFRHNLLQELPSLKLSVAKAGIKRTNIQSKMNLDKLRSYIETIRYRPTVHVPARGLYTPRQDDINTTVKPVPVLPSSVERQRTGFQPLVGVKTVFTRYWPAVLGVTIGTTFLLTALITSILCRQRRLLIQRGRWLDSPQHLSEPPDPSEYATSSAASLSSDLIRSTANLMGSRHGSQ